MLESLRTVLKGVENSDEYTELVMDEAEIAHVPIVVDRLENFTDSDRVARYLREGKIVFVRIGDFKNTNVDELRRTVSKIRNVVQAVDGDLVGIRDEWIIVAPSVARIERDTAA